MKSKLLAGAIFILILSVAVSCVREAPTPTPAITLSQYQLKYRLLAQYPDFFWTDSDFYPIAREGIEEKNSQEQFPTIQANSDEFSAILEHLKLPMKAVYANAEKLIIYREHKILARAVQIAPSGSIYNYSIRIGENQGFLIEGTITPSGQIKETKREPTFNTRPICLTKGTLIDTPEGPVPVEKLSKDMTVWTMDISGVRMVASISATSATPVLSSYQPVRLTLDDGRVITASPGHPSAQGLALGSYKCGDTLDRAIVTTVEFVNYNSTETYDLLPSGATGQYWANGILLKSTLANK